MNTPRTNFEEIFKFQNTNPARGRKLATRSVNFTSQWKYFRTQTPKGDGNLPGHFNGRNHLGVNFRTQTPKGDGNAAWTIFSAISKCISEHKPRKGTETSLLCVHIVAAGVAFQNTNPERGRKRLKLGLAQRGCILFQNTNPERGRKQEEYRHRNMLSW